MANQQQLDFALLSKVTANDRGDAVKGLIALGARPTMTDKNGDTPLHHTARHGNARNMDAILGAKPPVNALNRRGWTPLDFAIKKEDAECIRLLKEAGEKTGAELRAEGAKSP